MMQRGMMQMNRFRAFGIVQGAVVFSLLTLATPAHAQDLGDVINNTIKSMKNIPNVFSMIAYLSGLFLSVSAIMKIKDHVKSAGRPALPFPCRTASSVSWRAACSLRRRP